MEKIMFYIDMLDRTGAQRVMRNLAEYFDGRGYDVVLVNDFRKNDDNQFEVPTSVKRIFLQETNHGNAIVKNLSRITKLRKYIKQEKPDLIVSFLGNPNLRMLISSIGLKNKKIVSVRNDPYQEYGRRKIKQRIANMLFKMADGCVFQTEDASLYFDTKIRERAKIIFNPVGDIFYDIVYSESPKDIVTFGRLSEQKNHKMLIDAYAKIANRFPEHDLYIYGEGNLREQTEQYCRNLGLANRVFLPGNVADVPGLLSQSRMFVLSSDYEGMPNALMEALAVGVPAVSTDCPCGGPRTLIVDETQGSLVPCNDIDEFAKAMAELLSDEDRMGKMHLASKERARVFQSERVFSTWEEYFLNICNSDQVKGGN